MSTTTNATTLMGQIGEFIADKIKAVQDAAAASSSAGIDFDQVLGAYNACLSGNIDPSTGSDFWYDDGTLYDGTDD